MIALKTVHIILNQKGKILVVCPPKGTTKITKNRPYITDDVEMLLVVWINEKQLLDNTRRRQERLLTRPSEPAKAGSRNASNRTEIHSDVAG